jgi:N-acetylated-alpha-linked acidic dipeptidase
VLIKVAGEKGNNRIDLAPLRQEAELVSKTAESTNLTLADRLANGTLSAESLSMINDRLQHMERDWIVPEGLPGRPWWRNLYASADPDAGYAPAMLPGLRAMIMGAPSDQFGAVLNQYETAISRLQVRLQEMAIAITAR